MNHNETAMERLGQQVEDLTRQNRRLKQFGMGSAVVVGVFLFMGLTPPAIQTEQDQAFRQVKEFTLRDAGGSEWIKGRDYSVYTLKKRPHAWSIPGRIAMGKTGMAFVFRNEENDNVHLRVNIVLGKEGPSFELRDAAGNGMGMQASKPSEPRKDK